MSGLSVMFTVNYRQYQILIKSHWFSNFLRFRHENCWIFQKIVFEKSTEKMKKMKSKKIVLSWSQNKHSPQPSSPRASAWAAPAAPRRSRAPPGPWARSRGRRSSRPGPPPRRAAAYVGSPTQLSNYLTLKGSFSTVGGGGRPDYLGCIEAECC